MEGLDLVLVLGLLASFVGLGFVWYRGRQGRRALGRQAESLLAGMQRMQEMLSEVASRQQALELQLQIEHLHHLTSVGEQQGTLDAETAGRLRRQIVEMRESLTPAERS